MNIAHWCRFGAPRSTWWTSSKQVRLAAVLGALSIVAVTLWRVDTAKDSALNSHMVVAENLARSLADNTSAKLLAADILATGLVERLEHDGASSAALTRLTEMLEWRIGPVPGIRSLVAYASNGTVLAGSSPASTPGTTDVDRELLIHHSTHSDRQAYIGLPRQNTVTGYWTISLSRRFDRPDRGFGGIAVVTLELDDFYSTFDLGPQGSIALVRDDGTMIVRVPALAGRIGANIAGGPFFRAYLASPGAGAAEAVSKFDGRLRQENYNPVKGFPLVVFVASTRHDVLASWQEQAMTWVAVSLFSAALLSLLGWRLANQMDIAKRAERAVRLSEERFRSLYTKTPLPLHSLDQQGCIEHVSQAWLDVLGYDRDGVIGRTIMDFMTEPSKVQAIGSAWPKLLENGTLNDTEYQFVTKDGKTLDVIASTQVERDFEGNFLRVLGGLTDVTERRLAEEALRQAQKIEAIGQLTGGVAHDFNNLLAVVMGNLELLRKRLSGDVKALHLLENAMKGAQRGAGLTQRMLAFARKQHLKPQAVDLANLVREAADLLQHALGPAVRIDTRFPLHLACAQVDANQLELALLNLAVNARDAMPEGGTFTISAAEETVAAGQAEAASSRRYVRLSVSDTGKGMDGATLSRATEPFFTTKGVGKGTGLGLSMVHGLAAQSGGRLVLRSEVGLGTTAELWFPIPQAQRPAQAPPAATSVPPMTLPPFASLTILVVDDDSLVLSNTAAMLEDLGHTVLQAPSGLDALLTLGRSPQLDLLITDQAMPGMTGLQLAEAVHGARAGFPILLVSGYGDLPSEAARLPRLDKPFNQAALAAAVSSLMHQRHGAVIIPIRPWLHESRSL